MGATVPTTPPNLRPTRNRNHIGPVRGGLARKKIVTRVRPRMDDGVLRSRRWTGSAAAATARETAVAEEDRHRREWDVCTTLFWRNA